MAKKRRARIFLGFGYIFIGGYLIYVLSSSTISVFEHKNQLSSLEAEKEQLVKDQANLENELQLLNDEDYVTRYARENYIFTRDGEKVIQLPDANP